jgi:molybdopterin converting factor subunit 1
MKVVVRCFAGARERTGSATVTVILTEGATVGDLRRCLSADYPGLAALLERSAVAIDEEFAADSQVLTPNVEVALLPPVSGG